MAWLRMPLPFALDHINLWLLPDCIEGRKGWTLVDCGASTEDIREAWERLIAAPKEALGLDGLAILRIICTHMHPDHVGLAAASPTWSGCMWVQIMRKIAKPSSPSASLGAAIKRSQASRMSSVDAPQSTSVQPLRPSMQSGKSQRLM